MRHINIKTLYLVIPFLLLTFNSCKKDVAGPKGDPGQSAKKANAQQSERSFTVFPSSWTFSGGSYITDVYFPEISNYVLAGGEVKVYMKIGTEWWSLPYGVGDIFVHQTIEYGYLHLLYSKIHGSPSSAPTDQIVFRVVTYTPV